MLTRVRPRLIFAVLVGAFLVAALVAWRVYFSGPPSNDPSRKGPERWVQLERAEVVAGELSVSGRTNLLDGSRLQIEIGDQLFVMACEASGLSWSARSDVAVVETGRYPIVVRFRLEEQTESVQKALHFQPRTLEARGTLEVARSWPPAGSSKRLQEFRELFDAVNRAPRDQVEIERLDVELSRFARGAGVGGQRKAARSLRLALEVLRKREFEREEFESHVLRAHVAAGL